MFFGTNGAFYPCFLFEKSPIKYLTKGVSFGIIRVGKGLTINSLFTPNIINERKEKMSYRFYGGTRERTIEQDMADIEWLKKHGGKDALLKNAKGVKATNVLTLILVAIFLVGLGALIVWGIQNLATSGISWQLILFNPITFIALLVGYGWSQCR